MARVAPGLPSRDVDQFKRFNEIFGHNSGDDELLGSDEFLIVLPEHSLEQARKVAQ